MSKLCRILMSGVLVAPLLVGCADTTSAGQLADLQKRLEAQNRRTAAAEHKLDELENRVFLLTDQVESQKVAAIHKSKQPLPVVTLKPSSSDSRSDEITVDSSGEEIVFEGEARSPDPTHTVLRIDGTRTVSHRPEGHGSESRVSDADTRMRSAAKTPMPPPSSDENLGVAPVPPIRAGAATASAAATEHAPPAAEPLALYKSAYDDLRAGKHDAAEHGFREFVRRYPHHDYADNAQYWLGECFYDQRAFDKAAPEFRAVVTRWPTGNKAPDAMLKLGFSLLAMGDADKGRAALRELPATYPRTEAARLATERLHELGGSPTTEGSK